MTWVSSVVFVWSDHTCSHPKWPLTTCIFITNYILSVNQLDWGIPWQLDNRNYFIHTKINYLCYHIIVILTNVWKLQDRPLGQVLLPIIFIATTCANYALSGAFSAGDKRNLSVVQRNQSSERRVHKWSYIHCARCFGFAAPRLSCACRLREMRHSERNLRPSLRSI